MITRNPSRKMLNYSYQPSNSTCLEHCQNCGVKNTEFPPKQQQTIKSIKIHVHYSMVILLLQWLQRLLRTSLHNFGRTRTSNMIVWTILLFYTLWIKVCSADREVLRFVQPSPLYTESYFPDVMTPVGKLFYYQLKKSAFPCNVETFMLSESDDHFLPTWLALDDLNSTLYGIPSKEDIATHEILVIALGSERKVCGTRSFIIYVTEQTDFAPQRENIVPLLVKSTSLGNENEKFPCQPTLQVVLATVLLNVDITQLEASKRRGVLVQIGTHFGKSPSLFSFFGGKTDNPHVKSLNMPGIIAAGPGDGRHSTGPSSQVTWHIGCGAMKLNDPVIKLLESSAQDGTMSEQLGHSVRGWHITGGTPNHKHRVRRQVANKNSTPQPTPTFSLSATLLSSVNTTVLASLTVHSTETVSLTPVIFTPTVTITSSAVSSVTPSLNSTSMLISRNFTVEVTTSTVSSQVATTVTSDISLNSSIPELMSSLYVTTSSLPSGKSSVVVNSSSTVLSSMRTISLSPSTSVTNKTVFQSISTNLTSLFSTVMSTSIIPVINSTALPTVTSFSTSLENISSTIITNQSTEFSLTTTYPVTPSIFVSPSPSTGNETTTMPLVSTTSASYTLGISSTLSNLSIVFSSMPVLSSTPSVTKSESVTSVRTANITVGTEIVNSTVFPSISLTTRILEGTVNITVSSSQSIFIANTTISYVPSVNASSSVTVDSTVDFTTIISSSAIEPTSSANITVSSSQSLLIPNITMTSLILGSSSLTLPNATSSISSANSTVITSFGTTAFSVVTPTSRIESTLVFSSFVTNMTSTPVYESSSASISKLISSTVVLPNSSFVPVLPSSSLLTSRLSIDVSKFVSVTGNLTSYTFDSSVFITPNVTVTESSTIVESTAVTVNVSSSTYIPSTSVEFNISSSKSTPVFNSSGVSLTPSTNESASVFTPTTSTIFFSTFTLANGSTLFPGTVSTFVSITPKTTILTTSPSPVMNSSVSVMMSTASTLGFTTEPTMVITTPVNPGVGNSTVRSTTSQNYTTTFSGSPVSLSATNLSQVIVPSPTSSPLVSSTFAVTSSPIEEGVSVINDLGQQTVNVGESFTILIPADTFHSTSDGGTRNLSLNLLDSSTQPVTATSWLQINSTGQFLYGFADPGTVDALEHQFILRATDSSGSFGLDVFQVLLQQNLPSVSQTFTMTLNENYTEFVSNIERQVLVAEKIASYFGDPDTSALAVSSIAEGSVLYSWGNKTVRYEPCDYETNERLRRNLIDEDGEVKPEFISGMKPFEVYNVQTSYASPCLAGPSNPEGRTDEDEWNKAIIPGIIIAIILLLLAILLCFLFRRRRPLPVVNEKRTFKYRKPIVLDEEMEMDTRPRKSLVLDNEEAPSFPSEVGISRPWYDYSDDDDDSLGTDQEDYGLSPVRYSPPPTYNSYEESPVPPPYLMPPSYKSF